jgi:hypothetical protein
MKNEKKLLGLMGLKRSGKDTISDYLCKHYDFYKYSYADPIKRGCKELFGFSDYQVFGEGKDEIDPVWGCTPRDILKILGTEVGQFDLPKYIPAFEKIGRLIWVKRFEQWYYADNNSSKNIVLADLRFKHEAESIVSLGGEVWRVDRPGMNVGDFHASEKELFEIEYKHLIINDGNLDDLYTKINNLVQL